MFYFILGKAPHEENQETSAVISKCRNSGKKVSMASAFLQFVNCVSPASAFRHQGQSSTAQVTDQSGTAQVTDQSGIGIPASGLVRYRTGHGLVRYFPDKINTYTCRIMTPLSGRSILLYSTYQSHELFANFGAA